MVTIFHGIKDRARPGLGFLAGRGLGERPIMPSVILTILDYRSSTPEDIAPNTFSCSAGVDAREPRNGLPADSPDGDVSAQVEVSVAQLT